MNRQEYLYDVIKSVVVSEKSQNAQSAGALVLKVLPTADKNDIKEAVELSLQVKVDCVRTLNVSGKTKRNRYGLTRRQDWKKAYVKLADPAKLEELLNQNTVAAN